LSIDLSQPSTTGTGLVLAATGAVMAPLALFAPLGLAPLLSVAAFLVLVLERQRLLRAGRAFKPLAVLLLLLSAWGMLSASWATLPAHALFEGARFLVISASGLVLLAGTLSLPEQARVRIGRWTLIGIVATMVLAIIELWGNAPLSQAGLSPGTDILLTRFDRGSTTLTLLLWPALAGAGWKQKAGLILAVLVTTLALESSAARLAVLVGGAAWGVAWWRPRLVAGGIAAILLFNAFVLPEIAPDGRAIVAIHQTAPWLKLSAIHRFGIWNFVADRIHERPLLGWGMDGARELPGGHADFADTLPGTGLPRGSEALPLHPHDAPLQWRVELGLPGTFLCLAIIGWILWQIGWRRTCPRGIQALSLAFATTALPIALLSYGVWQAWWESCLWLAAALMMSVTPAIENRFGQADDRR